MTNSELHWQPIKQIQSQSLHRLLETWQQWAIEDGIPYRRRFDPADFPTLLPWIVLGEIVERPNETRNYDILYRYLGTQFTQFFAAGSTTRMHLSEVGPPYTERWFTMTDRVLTARAPCFFGGAPYGTEYDYLNLEMLALPFARDPGQDKAGETGFVMSAFARQAIG